MRSLPKLSVWIPETQADSPVLWSLRALLMKTSKAAIDVSDTGERWLMLVLAVVVLVGLAMLPA